jgi:hypothetical protein
MFKNIRFDYEVQGINLLQASNLYTYNSLREVIFEVLHNYAATFGNIFGTPVVEQLSVLS